MPMGWMNRTLVVVAACLVACPAEDEGDTGSTQTNGDASSESSSSTIGTSTGGEPMSCTDAQLEAAAFLSANRACTEDADCTQLGTLCLDGNTCGSSPIAVGYDEAAWMEISAGLDTCMNCGADPCGACAACTEGICTLGFECETEPPQPECRTYATAYTFSSSLGANYEYSCSHAETSQGFELSCAQGGGVDTRYWASTADFVAESRLVGLQYSRRFARDLTGDGTEDFEFSFEYDDMGRLERTSTDGEVSTTYDAWDDEGRATHGARAGQCAGTMLTSSYDDDARTVRDDDIGGPAGCETWIERTFDENMIITDVAYPDGVTATYTTHATDTVCL